MSQFPGGVVAIGDLRSGRSHLVICEQIFSTLKTSTARLATETESPSLAAVVFPFRWFNQVELIRIASLRFLDGTQAKNKTDKKGRPIAVRKGWQCSFWDHTKKRRFVWLGDCSKGAASDFAYHAEKIVSARKLSGRIPIESERWLAGALGQDRREALSAGDRRALAARQ